LKKGTEEIVSFSSQKTFSEYKLIENKLKKQIMSHFLFCFRKNLNLDVVLFKVVFSMGVRYYTEILVVN